MTTEQIITIIALAFVVSAFYWILRVGHKEAEMIFQSDYTNLSNFIQECEPLEENRLKIQLRIIHLSKMDGADQDKINELNFDSGHRFLAHFIRHCPDNDESEAKIRAELVRLSNIKGAYVEILQVLNSEFRRKFVPPTLSDVVADHENE
jgi:hypothetical protein